MAEREGRGCFRTGLLGCLVLMGLGFFGMLALGGMAFISARTPADHATDTVTHDLAGSLQQASLGEDGEAVALATEEQLRDAQSAEIAITPPVSRGVGTLDLDLSMGEFYIVPVAADQPLEVVAEYDKSRFRLEEDFSQDESEDWTYKVKFTGRRLLFGGNSRNRVEIRVPKGHPLQVVGEVRMGQAFLDLSGLALTNVDLETGMGEINVDIDEPTGMVADRFRVTGRMGALDIDGVGNASPREVDVSFRMGEAHVDLMGQWLEDSTVNVRCSMGECGALLPTDVFVEVAADAVMGGRNVRLPDQESIPEGAPTLTLDIVASMGEVRVR